MSVIMHVRFLLLFLVLLSSSQASIPNSTIDSDAVEINRLSEVLKSSSPNVFRRSQSLVCEMINPCCPFMKSRLAAYLEGAMIDGRALVSICVGNYPPQSILHTCPTLVNFITMVKDQDFHKYTNVLSTAMREIQSPNIIISYMYSSDEAYVMLCNGTQKHELESCERKKLAYVAQHRSPNDYQTFVQNSKNNSLLLIDAVKKAFPEVNVIETMTARITVGVKTNLLLLQSSSTTQIINASSDSAQKTEGIIITLLTFLYFFVQTK